MRTTREPDCAFLGARSEVIRWRRGVVSVNGRPTRRDQRWFWTRRWQAGEARADADLAAGRFVTFDTDEAFRAWLNE